MQKRMPYVGRDGGRHWPVGWVAKYSFRVLSRSEDDPADAFYEDIIGERCEIEEGSSPPDSQYWLNPSPDSELIEDCIIDHSEGDLDCAVYPEEIDDFEGAFAEKRTAVLMAHIRGESYNDFSGVSALGAHCLKQLAAWVESSPGSTCLEEVWLVDQDLSGIDFCKLVKDGEHTLQCANLSGANLAGANLQGFNFPSVDLSGANLKGANLKGACFGAVDGLDCACLQGADLSQANLSGAWVYVQNLKHVSLRDANLSGASFITRGYTIQPAPFFGADFSGTNLSGAQFSKADLRGAIFSGANLSGCDLTGCDLRGVDMQGAKTEGAMMEGARISQLEI